MDLNDYLKQLQGKSDEELLEELRELRSRRRAKPEPKAKAKRQSISEPKSKSKTKPSTELTDEQKALLDDI